MAKTSGLGDNLYVGGYNLSGDIGHLSTIAGGNKPLDVTGIDKSAHERIGGLRNGQIKFTAFFNTAAGQAHPVLSALPTADVTLNYCQGTTLGNPAAAMIARQISYDGKREASGAFTFDVDAMSDAYGLEWGVQLTAGQRTDTVATNGTGVDLATVSTAFGWQAYLQVFSVVGTSVTVTIQDSADNGTFANLSGAAFTAVNAGSVSAQRLAGGATDTVRRYLRVVSSGTFTSAVFAVTFVRNATATSF